MKLFKKSPLLLIIFAGVVLFFTITLTVNSRAQRTEVDQHYFDQIESEYITMINDILENHLLYNSGITMTRETAEDGSRSYRVTIYHQNISQLPDEERELLKEQLVDVLPADSEAGIIEKMEIISARNE